LINNVKNITNLRNQAAKGRCIYIAHVTVHFWKGKDKNCDTLKVFIENFQETVKIKKLPLNRPFGNNRYQDLMVSTISL
jgi:hypothetical protein